MFLLHVSVESRVGQVSLVAVLAFEVSTLVVVLASSLATLAHSIGIFLTAATPLLKFVLISLVLIVLIGLIFHVTD